MRSHSRYETKDTAHREKNGKTLSIESEQTASKCLFQKRRALPRGLKQQKLVEGTLAYAATLRRIRYAYIFRECNDFGRKKAESRARM